tara:strand:+ start:4756 stop:6075 length:1320 start_codon:yes stop_codon:yes gene_type:complete
MNKIIYKKNKYTQLLAIIFWMISCFGSGPIISKIELLDKVVAVVDSGVIMESELNFRVKDIVSRLKSDNTELPPINLLEEQVLNRLIIEEIQLQIADRAGIKISDSELNRTISGIADQNSLSLEEFRTRLESEGSSYKDFRKTIRKEMIIQRVQRGKVGSKVEISEQEIENFLNSEEGRSKLAEEYFIQQILISVKSSDSKREQDELLEKSKRILEDYKNGESFSKLATSFSSDQNALEGGAMGWRTAAQLPTLFAEAIKDLKVGEATEPFKSGAGYHILMLKEKRGNTVKFEDQTLARHILVQPSEIRTENQAENLINEIYQRALDGESFQQLARQYSEDPGSKMDGGELGWSSEGDYDPAFQTTLNQTEIGQISKPFLSSFGWHIIEVINRRNEDVSREEQKNRAYQIIFERKFEQELERALIEMRSEAYVDIKLST